MNPTLEKIARAMCDALGMNPDDWDEDLQGVRTYRWMRELPVAKASLAALLRPSPEMLEAMCNVGPGTNAGEFSYDDASRVFTAAIRYLLDEGEG